MCEQEGLTSAAVFSLGQSFHGTVLHGAGTSPAGLRRNNI